MLSIPWLAWWSNLSLNKYTLSEKCFKSFWLFSGLNSNKLYSQIFNDFYSRKRFLCYVQHTIHKFLSLFLNIFSLLYMFLILQFCSGFDCHFFTLQVWHINGVRSATGFRMSIKLTLSKKQSQTRTPAIPLVCTRFEFAQIAFAALLFMCLVFCAFLSYLCCSLSLFCILQVSKPQNVFGDDEDSNEILRENAQPNIRGDRVPGTLQHPFNKSKWTHAINLRDRYFRFRFPVYSFHFQDHLWRITFIQNSFPKSLQYKIFNKVSELCNEQSADNGEFISHHPRTAVTGAGFPKRAPRDSGVAGRKENPEESSRRAVNRELEATQQRAERAVKKAEEVSDGLLPNRGIICRLLYATCILWK